MSFRRYQKADRERTRKRHPQVSDTEDWSRADSHVPLSSNAIMHLQRTIGNRAVQRLIDQKMQNADPVVQRDGGKQEEAGFPSLLAAITTARQGRIDGKSKLPGHEGKLEFLSMNLDRGRASRNKDEQPPTNLVLTRNVDDLSTTFNQMMLESDPITSAQFEFIRRNDEGKVEVAHTLKFSDGLISSYSVSGGEQGSETMEMEFKKKDD